MKIARVAAVTIIAVCAALSFAAIDAAKYLGIIRAGLTDENREVREMSARALGAVGDKGAVESLKAMLGDPNDSLKIAAAVSLVKLGDRPAIAEIRKILKNAPVLSEKPTALERMKAITKGTVRAQAARELGLLKDAESIDLLKKMTDDDDGRVTDASVIALAALGDTSGKKEFISALESTKQEVRARAADALAEIGDKSAIVPLRKRLKDWDRGARSSAALALGRLGDKESVSALKGLLQDQEDIVKEKAAEALGFMGDKSVVPAIEALLKDKNGFVRFSAVSALHKLGSNSGKKFVLEALKYEEKDAKVKALGVLEEIAEVKDVQAIEPLVSDSDKIISITAARVILITESKSKVKVER